MTCLTCRFFARHTSDDVRNFGVCRRFPVNQSKEIGEWCGEHQPTETKTPVTLGEQCKAKRKQKNEMQKLH